PAAALSCRSRPRRQQRPEATRNPGNAQRTKTSACSAGAAGSASPDSQNVPGQVLVLDDLGEHPDDVGLVDPHGLVGEIGTFEGDLVEQLLEHGVQAAGADVLGVLV